MKMNRRIRLSTLLAVSLLICVASPLLLRADEGMWTFDNFPSRTLGAKYGFAPSQEWLDHVRLSSLRIAAGCSASFISPHGLVMTNHHCVLDCVQQLSTAQQNFVDKGFMAGAPADERTCPAFELDQLIQVRDVTPEIRKALAGKTGAAANSALHAQEAELQQSCASDPAQLCQVVSLYDGGIYDLYRYKKYTDVRLVFAPEMSVAQFGGDPDNFNFPRYDFDMGLLRVYEDGHPAATPDYLKWSAGGSKPGDLVFVSGNPGGTSRELTTAQLAFERDTALPSAIPAISEYRGLLEQFITESPERAREAAADLDFDANSYKVIFGREQALLDPQFFDIKVREEQKLAQAAAADPKLAADKSAWDDIARIQTTRAQLFDQQYSTALFRRSDLFSYAVALVRAAEERTKPNNQRLPEYTDQALAGIQQQISAPVPVYKDLEELQLAWAFSLTRRNLGVDDPFVRKMLGKESPEQLAQRLVSGTHLDDPSVREALYKGGETAVEGSTDPLIVFVRSIDPDLLAQRKEYEARVEAPTRAAAEKIAKARFAIYGASVYPDATFTLRLSYGVVKGFTDARGKSVEPYTTIGGLFDRATGAPPFDLPESWLSAKSRLNLETPMNLCTTNDIIGGNSGSPLINKDGEIVGLIFDGNIFSIGGDYAYDAAKNRAVAVDSRALLTGLSQVYHLTRIVNEIESARK
ncbi:MAG TPA: S46 family peptidase [Candidatus Acidoferrales bacterium]|nr:S46 family peptidase [Candidatus Acidoferrales bacterium]